MLYWGEGTKDRNACRFTNSDPVMVRFFVRFLRECFGVDDARIRVTCHLYDDHDVASVEAFWLEALDLPAECLTPSVMNKVSSASSGKRVRVLEHGTCRVMVNSTELVQKIYGAIQEYCGSTDTRWLD